MNSWYSIKAATSSRSSNPNFSNFNYRFSVCRISCYTGRPLLFINEPVGYTPTLWRGEKSAPSATNNATRHPHRSPGATPGVAGVAIDPRARPRAVLSSLHSTPIFFCSFHYDLFFIIIRVEMTTFRWYFAWLLTVASIAIVPRRGGNLNSPNAAVIFFPFPQFRIDLLLLLSKGRELWCLNKPITPTSLIKGLGLGDLIPQKTGVGVLSIGLVCNRSFS